MTETRIRGLKGMTSAKELPVLRDGPPPGGFPAMRYARRIANAGPSGVTALLVSSACTKLAKATFITGASHGWLGFSIHILFLHFTLIVKNGICVLFVELCSCALFVL